MEPAVNLSPEIESQALAIPEQAHSIVVVDNDSMERANQFNLDIRQSIKDIQDWFDPLVSKAHAAHKALTLKRSETLKPLEDAAAYITGQVKGYLRKVREEEERQAAILREQARKEEEDRRLAMAAELESAGNIDEANEILDEPITYVAPVPAISMPRVDHRMYSVKRKARVIDKMALIRTVANNPALQDLLDVNMTVANQKAKSLGVALNMSIKGLEYYEE